MTVSVCLSASISPELHVRSSLIFMCVNYVCGSVLLWRRCDTLCTSGLWITSFAHNGQYGEVLEQPASPMVQLGG